MRGEPVVLRSPPGHGAGLARGPGDRGRAGEGLQRPVVDEPGAVVADLGEHDRAADVGQAGEAGDDLVVRVLSERLDQRGGELVDRGADRVEHAEQGERLGRASPAPPPGLGAAAGSAARRPRCAARLVMRRCRPPRRSAVSTRAFDTVNPSAGLGAIASTARASALASWVVESPRPEPDPAANAARKPG